MLDKAALIKELNRQSELLSHHCYSKRTTRLDGCSLMRTFPNLAEGSAVKQLHHLLALQLDLTLGLSV